MKTIVSLWWKDICWRAVFTILHSAGDTESKVYATILGGADGQGVLGNAKITNTCGYINVT